MVHNECYIAKKIMYWNGKRDLSCFYSSNYRNKLLEDNKITLRIVNILGIETLIVNSKVNS